MNIKKLFFAGILFLFTSPLAFAAEIGTGSPATSNAEIGTGTPTQSAEIGTGTPSAEIGTGDSIESALIWWNLLLMSI